MEDLTKTQTILLTLFVSFVTSIATGITTVTLMDQAPPTITQTLNRVVERTVEKVIQPASVVTKEVKVVVKEEDAVVSAFEKNQSSVVRVMAVPAQEKENPTPAGLGVFVSSDGIIAIDKSLIAAGKSYHVLLEGTEWGSHVVIPSEAHPLAYLFLEPLALPEEDTKETSQDKLFDSVKRAVGIKEKTLFPAVSFGSSQKVKPGQTAVIIGGAAGDTLMTGIISRIAFTRMTAATTTESGDGAGNTAEISPEYLSAIYIDVSVGPKDVSAPLINIDGNVVGIFVLQKEGAYAVPSDLIKQMLALAIAENTQQKKDIDEN